MSETEKQPTRQGTRQFKVEIDQLRDYEFSVKFENPEYPPLTLDAPAPLGRDAVPSPSRLLAAAVGHCLASGLLYVARKACVPMGPIHATVRTDIVRNPRGLPRIGKIDVEIDPGLDESARQRADPCVRTFEDICMVSASVREGIDIAVRVKGFSTTE